MSRAEYYERLGTTFQLLGVYTKARNAFQWGAKTYARLGDRFGELDLSIRLGDVERQLENFEDAIRRYRHSQRLWNQLKKIRKSLPRELFLDAECGKVLCLRALGRFEEVSFRLRALIKLYKNRGDKQGLAYLYWALGTTQRFMGHLHEAPRNLQKSILLYKQSSDISGLAYSFCGLGGIFRMIGEARMSGDLYRKANGIFKKMGDQFGLAYSFCGQGNAERMKGFYAPSIKFFSKAIAIYQQQKLSGPLGFVLWSRAQSEMMLGLRKKARKNILEAGRLFRAVRDERGLVYYELGMGEYFRAIGSKRGRPYYKRAFKSAQKLGLALEVIHAKRGLMLPDVPQDYRRLGINTANFKTYATLP